MPIIKIFTDLEPHDHLEVYQRNKIQYELQRVLAWRLRINMDNVSVHWFCPSTSAVTYSVEIELISSYLPREIENLLDALIQVFKNSPHIPSGADFGVGIKAHGIYKWKQDIKS